ncbi:MAG TPA: cell division protein SepF [Acidimicrobiales bacterium]|nr:cell division protein SepF [Acidimicrobiales bacterium]
MSLLKKTMVYLGLGPDEEYEDYDAVEAPPARPERPRPSTPQGARPQRPRPARTPRPEPRAEPSEPPDSGSVRALGPPARPQPVRRDSDPARQSAVRAIPTPSSKPHVVQPTSFNDVQQVADRFKTLNPVIVNLQGVNRDLSRRLIDFASGLCYGLGGNMERVADSVYLLTPSDVELSDDERRHLQDRGLVDR